MLALCGHLPQLAAVRFDMWCISESGVGSIVGAIGARLRVLCVQGETITGNYIGDGTLIALTTVCPNLERFTYVLGASYWNAGADGLSERGVVALVRDGKRLARLELEGTQNVGLTAFQDIAQMLGGGGFAACGGASSAATAQGGGAPDGATDGTPESEEADPDGDVLTPPSRRRSAHTAHTARCYHDGGHRSSSRHRRRRPFIVCAAPPLRRQYPGDRQPRRRRNGRPPAAQAVPSRLQLLPRRQPPRARAEFAARKARGGLCMTRWGCGDLIGAPAKHLSPSHRKKNDASTHGAPSPS